LVIKFHFGFSAFRIKKRSPQNTQKDTEKEEAGKLGSWEAEKLRREEKKERKRRKKGEGQ
jgi:hypothetical protein